MRLSGSEVGRPRVTDRISGERRWILGLVLAALVLVVFLYPDFGIPWDEPLQAAYGEWTLQWFRSGGGVEPLRAPYLEYYDPFYEAVAALLVETLRGGRESPALGYDLRHLLLALLASTALFGVARWNRRLDRGLVGSGALAVLSLAMMPRFVGHAFTNSKDLPFAVAHLWFLVALAGWLDSEGRSRSRLAGIGVALGLALAARPGALPLLALELAAGSVLLGWYGEGFRPGRAAVGLLWAPPLFAIGWGLMVLPWPWALGGPLVRPLEAIRFAASFAEPHRMLFAGRVLVSTDLPWHYPLTYLAVTTPLPILALALVGLGHTVRVQVNALKSRDLRGLRAGRRASLTQIWILAPLAAFAALRPPVYDGLRHFLFLLPGVAVLAGLGAAALVAAMVAAMGRQRERWRNRGLALALAVMAAAIVSPAISQARLHPYQVTYFNALVGGVGGASNGWDTDYWAASHREAARWLAGALAGREGPVRIGVAGSDYVLPALAVELPREAKVVAVRELRRAGGLPPGLDAFVASSRFGAHQAFADAPIVYRVERAGATFAVVRMGKDEGGRAVDGPEGSRVGE